jgi:hypothetical protein
MTKHCKCIKKYIKLTAPHHRKKRKKNTNYQFPKIQTMKDKIREKNQ